MDIQAIKTRLVQLQAYSQPWWKATEQARERLKAKQKQAEMEKERLSGELPKAEQSYLNAVLTGAECGYSLTADIEKEIRSWESVLTCLEPGAKRITEMQDEAREFENSLQHIEMKLSGLEQIQIRIDKLVGLVSVYGNDQQMKNHLSQEQNLLTRTQEGIEFALSTAERLLRKAIQRGFLQNKDSER